MAAVRGSVTECYTGRGVYSLKERDYLKDIGVDGIKFMHLRIRTDGGML
jgi:hypothetical protein